MIFFILHQRRKHKNTKRKTNIFVIYFFDMLKKCTRDFAHNLKNICQDIILEKRMQDLFVFCIFFLLCFFEEFW